MIDIDRVILTQEEMEDCLEFSKKSAKTQQAVEFGQKTTKERRTAEIARDNMIGKMAEVAFSKIMWENYGILVDLDFEYYPRGKWDNQDALINGWRVDVKGTRRGGRFMLIEWNKLDFRQRYNNLSHVFAMFTVDWDRDRDLPRNGVRFEGLASLNKMRGGCRTTQTLRKGDLIPGTNVPLQADNFGIRFCDLSRDLDTFAEYITNSAPPFELTRNFRNPYLAA